LLILWFSPKVRPLNFIGPITLEFLESTKPVNLQVPPFSISTAKSSCQKRFITNEIVETLKVLRLYYMTPWNRIFEDSLEFHAQVREILEKGVHINQVLGRDVIGFLGCAHHVLCQAESIFESPSSSLITQLMTFDPAGRWPHRQS
jgi:hypothetical protein